MGTREAVSAVCFVAEEASHELLWSGPIPVAVASSVVLLLLLLLVTPPSSSLPHRIPYSVVMAKLVVILRHCCIGMSF